MNHDLETFAQHLQAHILEETRSEWGEKAYERWRNPRYMGVMHNGEGL